MEIIHYLRRERHPKNLGVCQKSRFQRRDRTDDHAVLPTIGEFPVCDNNHPEGWRTGLGRIKLGKERIQGSRPLLNQRVPAHLDLNKSAPPVYSPDSHNDIGRILILQMRPVPL